MTIPDAVAATIDDRMDRYTEQLLDLLAQPSVSANGEGMDDCVPLVGALMDDAGLDTTVVETARYPIVYGERHVDETLPTVVFYGHYDVQPPGDPDLWETPAFEPTVRDGSVYARGAGDNKGQFVTHLFALDAVPDADLACNVKVLVEGGEESGSVGLLDYLHDEPTEIADADLIYAADGPMHRSRRPTLIYGNRGVLSVQLDLERADADLHSGNFGGPVPNAANDLVRALSTAFDGTHPTIEGVGDDLAVTDADREMVADIPVDEAALRAELGVDEFVLASGKTYYERLLLEPTCTVNGLRAGYGGEGTKTIIPHRATAKLDFRLVPDQDPETVLERVREHFRRVDPAIEVTAHSSFPPMKTPLDTPAADAVAAALKSAWGREPVELPLLGGSLPAAHFREALDVPVLVVPYANPDQWNHSPNEHLDLNCLHNGVRTSAGVLRSFAGTTD